MLEVDEDVRIAVARRSIASVVPPEELQRLEAAGEDETDEGLDVEEPLTAEERTSSR
jgi:hypothetical protein